MRELPGQIGVRARAKDPPHNLFTRKIILGRTSDGYTQGEACPAGELFYDKCNLCECGANGLSATCTLTACPSEDTRRKARASEIYSWPHIGNYYAALEAPSSGLTSFF